MLTLFACPQGHQWEAPADSPAVCPICGSQHVTEHGSSANVPTLPPTLVPQIVADVAAPLFAGSIPTPAGRSEFPKVAGFEILGVLGRGGMGVVYKAQQPRLGRLVALKMVLAGAHAGPEALMRFHLEAEALAGVQHPHIVQVYEVGEHERSPYLALEFIDGPALDKKIGDRPQAPRQAAQLIETLARAISCAHQRGVVHRDLKPANVLLTKDGVPKITDFGLAKRLGEHDSGTKTGAVMGTPSYMAPEQAAGKSREIGPATDIYGLGAILYHLLTGRPPFASATTMETIHDVQTKEPVAPRRVQSKIPADLETICLKCLAKEPLKRYGSALDLAEDLRRFLAGEPILARPTTLPERLWKWSRRRPTAAALIAVSILAAVGFAGGLIWHTVQLGAERDYAERNFQRALAAVDQMLTEVAEEQLAWEPRMEEKRRALLERALTFYQQFLAEKGADPAVRKETGLAYKRVGDIYRLLEQYDQARQAYGQAIGLLSQLANDFPFEPGYRRDLAACHNFLGEVLRQASRPREARASYQKALDLQQQLVAQDAAPAYRLELANTEYNLGILLKDDNQPAEAEAALLQAIDLLSALVTRARGEPKYRQHLARAYLNLGPVLRATNRPRLAQERYNDAIDILKKLASEFPDNPDYQHELGVCFLNLGNLLAGSNHEQADQAYTQALGHFQDLVRDFRKVPAYRQKLANLYNSVGSLRAGTRNLDGAKTAWEKALALFDKLAAERPNVRAHKADLGIVHGNLGLLSTKREDWAGARPQFRQAVAYLKEALQPGAPRNPTYLAALCSNYQSLAATSLELKDHAAAAEAACAMPEVFGNRGIDYYYAACFLSRCVPLAGAEAERKAYTDKTAVMLRGAADRGVAKDKRLPEIEEKNMRPLQSAVISELLARLDGGA
jgi:serine/threonine-protein kinase